jgi:hypothetical protein
VSRLKTLPWNCPVGAEECHESSDSGESELRPEFELGPSRIKVRGAEIWANCLGVELSPQPVLYQG